MVVGRFGPVIGRPESPGAGATVTLRGTERLSGQALELTYTAVRLCSPGASVVVWLAVAAVVRDVVASTVVLSWNVTVPVGVLPVQVTVAVSVTSWPASGFDGVTRNVTLDVGGATKATL